MHAETKRAGKRRSVLRKYAATNEAELFAVATEAFFERPRALAAKHPKLTSSCARRTVRIRRRQTADSR
jgi:Mlc titration factor MtfA (ptsG expression regulator)